MHSFCIFIKTYSGDIVRAQELLASIGKHNKDNIDVVVSVPQAELALFTNTLSQFTVTLLADESINSDLFTEKTNGFAPGYLNQQIIKLSFWELGSHDHYLCVDSDALFIRDFYRSDFFFDDSTPYSNLYEWEAHFSEYKHRKWVDVYKRNLAIISKAIDLDMSRMVTCCGNTILSSVVLRSFKEDYLRQNHKTYKDILRECPFEFSWYSLWLIKCNLLRIVPINGFFKIYHFRSQYTQARFNLTDKEQLAKLYVGIIINSNWKPRSAPLDYKNPNVLHLLHYRVRDVGTKLGSALYKLAKQFTSYGHK